MKRIHTTAALSGLALSMLLVTTACAGPSEPVDDDGSGVTPGTVNVYTSELLTYNEAIDAAFMDATPHQVITAPRVVAAELIQRVEAEEAAGGVQADVLQIADKSIWVAHPDWFEDLADLGLENYDAYPDDSKWQGKCVATVIQAGGFVYNNQLVDAEHAPQSWEDLLDPYFKDKLTLTDPRASGPYMSWALRMMEVYGEDYLKGIAAQNPVLFDSASPAAQDVAAGAHLVNVQGFASNSSELIEQGAPLTWVPGADPSTGQVTCTGILKRAKNLEAAKAYLDFLMTEEAQSAGCTGIAAGSALGNIPNCLELPENWEPSPIDEATGQFVGVDDQALVDKALAALGIS
jgi:iron(III) transport system substrate-binding protein